MASGCSGFHLHAAIRRERCVDGIYLKRRMILNELKAPGPNQASLLRKTGGKCACNCCHKEWHCVMPVLRFC